MNDLLFAIHIIPHDKLIKTLVRLISNYAIVTCIVKASLVKSWREIGSDMAGVASAAAKLLTVWVICVAYICYGKVLQNFVCVSCLSASWSRPLTRK